ncbi:MAG TPA: ATP-dependent DNA helicase RecG [Dehalococcoidales bacterium]|nr:ATP-dependent DNA helicase RecG [Dehalococcoidales bacterium]
MTISQEFIHKALELEIKKNCQDTAVIGGLDRLLQNWLSQMNSEPDKGLYRRILKIWPSGQSYASLTVTQRQSVVNGLLKAISEKSGADSRRPAGGNAGEIGVSVSVPIKKVTAASRNGSASIKALPQALDEPVTKVKGISEVLSKKFAKLGVQTVRDLLYYFPHRHIDYSQRAFVSSLKIGQENTIVANVWESREVQLGTRRSAEATVGDETGNVRVIWFNQPYMARSIRAGARIIISGKVSVFSGRPVFESPEWEPYEDKDLVHTGRMVPVYPLTEGLSQRQIRRIIKPALDLWCGQVVDFLPAAVRARQNLVALPAAIIQQHYPENEAKKAESRRRLAFDELFLLQLGVMSRKRQWQESQAGISIRTTRPELQTFLTSLPFQLTGAQRKALEEIMGDLQKVQPMSRLLQGDVGSGKTVVAAAALILTVADGYQGAMMAPTEILAEQHWITIRKVLSAVGTLVLEEDICRVNGFLPQTINIALLKGDMGAEKKRRIAQAIAGGEIDIAIGTHALIQKNVKFEKLGLVVVDEQHRFGVEQRSALRQKGVNPHVLVMTATPIPRTLALTLYGDLDISVIDELPPGRQTIKTKWLRPEQRPSAYAFIRKQVQAGHQAFIICPLVEESDAIQARAAVAEFEELSHDVFPDLKLGLLHGRMSSRDKEAVMQQFNRAELDILVSTPVVEVGIDVPNATVMLIESADRFGLSQIHQFRGRVGRGKDQSYCMLMAENPTDIGRQRLDLIEKVHNGFLLAEEDLKLRGPGEFFGTRQSGLPDLKMARLTDVTLLEIARNEAIRLFKEDALLNHPENRLLAENLAKVWTKSSLTETS